MTISSKNLFDSSGSSQYLISIEGNIGSGKTTLLQSLNQIYPYPIFFEPVNEWKFLDAYYTDQKKYSFVFQLEVLFSFQPSHKQKGLSFSERSTASGFLVFATLLRDEGILNRREFDQLELIWERYNIFPNLVVYVDTQPSECLQRIQIRNRPFENTIDLAYLTKLHLYHKKFLQFLAKRGIKIVTIDGTQSKAQILEEFQQKLSKFFLFSNT